MKGLITWFRERFLDEDDEPTAPLRQTGARVVRKPVRPGRPAAAPVDFSSELEGKIVDGGPGKNVLVRNKYLREETGTHDTLKIIDDSIMESDDEDGIDPYNTGRFDRSKSWDTFRSRK
jgi:hypothetical protein